MSPSGGDPQTSRLARGSLRTQLRSQTCVIGTFLEIPAPALVELLGLAGFDFVVIDREHGPIDLKDTEQLIRAGASTGISVVVRTPNSLPTEISQPLDMGAAGIQVPQVESAEMAQAVVAASKYYPLGTRGLQPYVRSASYRAYPTAEYLATANEGTLVVVHVEGERGVANLDSIVQVEGLDVVFIGPYDLSQSLGIPGQVNDARVRNAMLEACRVAKRHGKRVGTYSDDVETALVYRDAGVSYLTISIDAGIFLASARSIISQMKPSRTQAS